MDLLEAGRSIWQIHEATGLSPSRIRGIISDPTFKAHSDARIVEARQSLRYLAVHIPDLFLDLIQGRDKKLAFSASQEVLKELGGIGEAPPSVESQAAMLSSAEQIASKIIEAHERARGDQAKTVTIDMEEQSDG